ncbi:Phospho-N-acetylmuramoyl-pentapeptide-transferase [Actinopolymorpha cephalotaxi]|uniref:Phospho-N-acetylmuramoyl-pentapeptide-transferase n=1 Tax=Actinopolymorpha cephalotaxi TaxID=504797 RepID=A0A1I2WBK5_9ACTN|nr:phospho-N-acetylmuramoyl-pentapeptide-transferase [Actinopolymorpha cephalotaxi]NYH82683.1 phospho-N-acetylmuramoyl-pentapeptide-transferase [Actinopolymorpha cephalotaxi]SFG98029.1 Phospho-N-acetylmuramoyl-pentapeptide-transferase [Actinopolymorpha cephalotaxi]
MKAILLAGGVSLLISLLGTPVAIRMLAARGYGQIIRDDGPTSHHTKRGTPTMGGVVIIVAAVLGYIAAHLFVWRLPSASGALVLMLMVGLGLVGFLDDYLKVSRQRSLGLRAKTKLAGQTSVAVIFAILALQFPDERNVTPGSTFVSFIRDIRVPWLELGSIVFVLWVLFLIAATSNGVNLTDGLDGLATGASVMVFAAYTLICVWQFNQACFNQPAAKCYEVRDPYDLAVVAFAVTAACFGFLWWNASPAKIIMGDTGSLALGGGVAAMAVFTRTELLLIAIGGLFLIEVASVMLQTGFFKFTRWRTGTPRRIFRMAPIHHHFELKGWNEVTIVIRFWIICGICVAGAIGIFYAEWVSGA